MKETINVAEIARELHLDEEELLKHALRDYLHNRLKELATERRTICARLGVSGLSELERRLKQGQVKEEKVFEDYQRLDWLEHQLGLIRRFLRATRW
ncbi:hypothetical protein HRbin07_00265 [bacterium HR07]|nr:hypothetical protein HRbin07_00265 [bacterium HR07]